MQQTRELVSSEAVADRAVLLPELMKTALSPNEFFKDDIEPDMLRQYLSIASQAYLGATDAVSKLKPFLGRILVLYKRHPELYQARGYKSYDHWMSDGVRQEHGLNRGQAYECVNIAIQCGNLPSVKIRELGFSKLNTIAKIIKQSVPEDATVEMRETKVNEWTEIALNTTVAGLKEEAEKRNVVDPGSLDPRVALTLMVNPHVKDFWEAFSTTPEVKTYCETEDPGSIFEKAIQECCTEWQTQKR